ncbi:phosphoribosylformylglycinamidine synthase [Petromyzon marinus]|uniref:Phosphoribosylformylglycinamidine synthase n=1 Tax=Petromyzon marinus TaxID=7757 RepID=A0AAJ7XH11_PETMA|nr:phosphoribosylformylglycinamidine synthase [Petromyzon marinus]
MGLIRFYARPERGLWSRKVVKSAEAAASLEAVSGAPDTEFCYNVEWDGPEAPSAEERRKLLWLFHPMLGGPGASSQSCLNPEGNDCLIEVGPRLNFSTAWSTNAVSICHSIGLHHVKRIECSQRHLFKVHGEEAVSEQARRVLASGLHDRTTECVYDHPLGSFALSVRTEPVYHVDVLGEGRAALERANRELGLALDEWDLDYYTRLFRERVGRNPTSVECFDIAQSNSEHSRHWLFRGRLTVDGQALEESLFDMIIGTQQHSNPNNVIKFSDNSSAIRGGEVRCLVPAEPGAPSPLQETLTTRHVIFTAETHNFPTGVAPFSGATTGTGGRIRDVQSTGRGAHVIAGTAGYCFGNLLIPEYELPWEDASFRYPGNFATPLEIAVEASNGASDYGNKFGEPLLAGFARSFGLRLPSGERCEWVKPVMFSGGIGAIEDRHVGKMPPEPGMAVVKMGGPAYRIGVGGGAASSVEVQGDNSAELDLGAVQRGDAEMEQRMNRALRGCIEMGGDANPVLSIHDQGAGGNGNVLKELVEPAGAVIHASNFSVGDPTLSALELWGAEYQESNALLVSPGGLPALRRLCRRERCPLDVVGTVTGDGRVVLVEDRAGQGGGADGADAAHPVDLQLDWVLGKMPRKEFVMAHENVALAPLRLPDGLSVRQALERVLRLPSVASKRYLTNKVDRSVTGLVAQQQCVGPLHTPLADVAVVAHSMCGTVGAATSIGEQPIKGLVDPAAGARMAVGEALTNLCFARVSALGDVKCSGNWMWAAKLPGEGARLVTACRAMCSCMRQLGIAVDGGKDSLSMAARVGSNTVKAPGALVISAYVGCPDITATVTPDLKSPDGEGVLLHVSLGPARHRLGGSALAQCYGQIGDSSPDMDSPETVVAGFNVTQELLVEHAISAGHDVSDGGLLVCLLEMAFAGNRGIDVEMPGEAGSSALELLFAEELGLVLEVSPALADAVCHRYRSAGVACSRVGRIVGEGETAQVRVRVSGEELLSEPLGALRDVWEATGFALEELQANPACVRQEREGLSRRVAPPYRLTFDPSVSPSVPESLALARPLVATVREEGSNGDREMAAALHMAGFEVWDVTMSDVCTGAVTLERFRGLVFVGGFSYADVLGSARGWAASVLFNASARAQFAAFRRRSDTFSLGVCNGCQLMALLGWVGDGTGGVDDGGDGHEEALAPGVVLAPNVSGRFESRFVSVRVQEDSPALLLSGMGGSVLGVWVAHGEGRMAFSNEEQLERLIAGKLAPLRYVDDQGSPTESYPLNPNGSPRGVAALCSPDGRHLAMMPHPERCVLPWQWAWAPTAWRGSVTTSPWLRLFSNARAWCLQDGAAECQ